MKKGTSMATAQAQTTTNGAAPAKRGRVSAADAAYSITFVDAAGKETSRIPQNVTAVKVTDALKKTYSIPLSVIAKITADQLLADMTRKKLNAFLGDVTKETVSKVSDLVGEFVTVVKNDTLYVAKEGGGPGRTFDADFWLDVAAKTAELKIKQGNKTVKPQTAQQREDGRVKLLAYTPEQRKVQQAKWMNDPVFKYAHKLVQAEREKAKAGAADKTEYNALADF